jgi:hypothetical protein
VREVRECECEWRRGVGCAVVRAPSHGVVGIILGLGHAATAAPAMLKRLPEREIGLRPATLACSWPLTQLSFDHDFPKGAPVYYLLHTFAFRNCCRCCHKQSLPSGSGPAPVPAPGETPETWNPFPVSVMDRRRLCRLGQHKHCSLQIKAPPPRLVESTSPLQLGDVNNQACI